MRRWKLLLTGAPGAGKSTLCRTLFFEDLPVTKTQCPEYHRGMAVDLPGEYLTVPRLRMAFLASVQDVHIVLYVQAADEAPPSIPPGLLQTMPGLTLAGVISKTDSPNADMERSRKHLRHLGLPEPYFEICCLDETSVVALRRWLDTRLPGFTPVHKENQCETNGSNGREHDLGA